MNHKRRRESSGAIGGSNTFLRGSGRTMAFVRQQIERGGERLWRLEDFRDRPFAAVAQALSRLTRQGRLERLSKGVYYRTRDTSFGKSRPNPAAIQRLASRRKSVFPSGIAAANLLGFSTQTKQNEVATSALSLPRKLVGSDTVIHTTSCAGRPERASCHRKRPSPAPSCCFRRKGASTACSELQLRSPRASER